MEEMCVFHASLPLLESLLNGGKVSFQQHFFGLDFWVHYNLPVQKFGRAVRVSLVELQRWLEERQHQ
jgi:hypothetical protein